ncbi:hypothetical protein Leryth_005909 [Lithospermum erythrorhizon]|nr:hypothetical protein Leryth_005909 [Lithospermum erythrorhizon]
MRRLPRLDICWTRDQYMFRQICISDSLEIWRKCNAPVCVVSIPHTKISELRLTNNARKMIKSILKLALKGLSTDERAITNMEYDNIFVEKGSDDVWVAAPIYQKWSQLKASKKVEYLKKIESIITRLVTGGDSKVEMPKDIHMLIEYFNGITGANKFNPKVALCHPSIMCYSRMMLCAEYIYFHLMYELESMPGGMRTHTNTPQLSGSFFLTIQKDFGQFTYKDVKDMNDNWMCRASANSRIRYLHGLVNQLGDPVISRSLFGYLVIMKHGVKHLLDPPSTIDPQNKLGLALGDTITREDADDYLYAMYPVYMSKLVRILIENDLLSDCWKLHGSP